MATTIPFTYGEFYDYPRMIRFRLDGEWFFLRSYFDDDKDDYADFYEVYILPFRSEEEFKADPYYWKNLSTSIHLGQVPIADLGFDETHRKTIDARAFQKLLAAHKKLVNATAPAQGK